MLCAHIRMRRQNTFKDNGCCGVLIVVYLVRSRQGLFTTCSDALPAFGCTSEDEVWSGFILAKTMLNPATNFSMLSCNFQKDEDWHCCVCTVFALIALSLTYKEHSEIVTWMDSSRDSSAIGLLDFKSCNFFRRARDCLISIHLLSVLPRPTLPEWVKSAQSL